MDKDTAAACNTHDSSPNIAPKLGIQVRRRMSPAKQMAITATLSVLLIVGKFSLSWLANVEVVTTLIFVSTVVFGLATGLAAVNVFILADSMLYGFFPSAAISYIIYFNLMVILAHVLHRLVKSESLLPFLILALLLTLSFGFLTTIFDCIFMGGAYWPRYLFGLPFYAAHLASTTGFMLIGFVPLVRLGKKFRTS